MPRNYAAFISYRHRPLDIAVAEKIHKSIERFKIPRDLLREERKSPGSVFTNWKDASPEGNLLVFRDREELPLSNDLTGDIFTALDHARCLIVVCTPDTPKSMWVRREISYFIEKHGRQRIITVLADGTPEESIPKEITTVYAEDGVTVLEEFEPLVAYVTGDSRKKVLKNLDKELLRLCAAVLGCPYDSLRQRHKRRKMQQTMAAIAAAFVVALSFIGMLINRNLEIQAQKRSVQLRESQLLAADAAEALAAGDTLLAIESAVSALPKAGDQDRPYYAPAESVLMEAMDILGGTDSPVLLKELTLEQMTPIAHFCLSTDGTLAVTLDDYGVLHCFDTESGEELWSDILTSASTDGSEKTVMISEDGRFLICRYYDLLECRNPQTGEILWSFPLEFFYNGYYIYDHARNRMALLRYYFSTEQGSYCLELILLNAETGKILSHTVLEQADFYTSYSLINTASTRLPQNGVFSEDGTLFACAFSLEDQAKDTAGVACLVVDLQNMQVVSRCSQDLNSELTWYVTAMEMRQEQIFLALESSDDTVAATVLKLDGTTGEILWCTQTPSELEKSTFSLDQTSTVLFWESIAIVGRYERLYALDLETGAVLNSIQLPGTLSYLYNVSPRNYGFSLSDGTYAIGWYNPNYGFILSTDVSYQVFADVGTHTLLMPYRGGIVQMYVDSEYFELSISNIDREGYLALVPYEKQNRLILKRPVTVEKPLEETIIALPVEQENIYCVEMEPTFCSDNTLILGPFSVYLEDDSSQYFYTVIDRETHRAVKRIDVEFDYNQKLWFFPDGSGYLRYTEGTTWLHRDGTSVPVAERKDPSFPEASYVTDLLIATDTVRQTDGRLLTAHCDSKTLTLLINGEKTSEIPLPRDHQYDAAPADFRTRRIIAGKNGTVLIGCNVTGEELLSQELAVYHPDAGWIGFPETFRLSNHKALAFAGQSSQMALVDSENRVRLFRLETGEAVTSFPLLLPSRSVLYMDFILEDQFLMIKTKDAQILIYDLATGEICFHDKLGSAHSGTPYSYVDAENQRLYIIDSGYSYSPNCLCIDLRSWTTLGTGSRILCYEEGSGALIHFDKHHDAQDALSCIRIPGTEGLVVLGQQMLAAR